MHAPSQHGHKIFLCYRRHDSAFETTTLSEKLKHAFGSAQVFQDIDDIPMGVDFDEKIRSTITGCDATIVVIGARWQRSTEPAYDVGNEKDYVRKEVEMALATPGQRVIPLVLDDATFPLKAADLPASLRGLNRKQASRVSTEKEHLHRDLNAFVRALQQELTQPEEPKAPRPKWALVTFAIVITALAALWQWRPLPENPISACRQPMRARIDQRVLAIEQQLMRCRRPRDFIIQYGNDIYKSAGPYDSLSVAMVHHGKSMVRLIAEHDEFRTALSSTNGSALLVGSYDELWLAFKGGLHDTLMFDPKLPSSLNQIGLSIWDAQDCAGPLEACQQLEATADKRVKAWLDRFDARLAQVNDKKRAFIALVHTLCADRTE